MGQLMARVIFHCLVRDSIGTHNNSYVVVFERYCYLLLARKHMMGNYMDIYESQDVNLTTDVIVQHII